MKLGFVSAILPEMPLDEVLEFGASAGFSCVELMCWPKGTAERRYAGVTHVDAANLTPEEAGGISSATAKAGVSISGLGYYPNVLCADRGEAQVYIDHLRHVIVAAHTLGVDVVNTFIGRDPVLSVEENWPRFLEVWPPLVQFAAQHGVRIAIENCPMFFTRDEWPGGKNLARSPAVWRPMFDAIPDANFGLNFDPSHLVWQRIDCQKALRDFASRIFHVHAKDARVDLERLAEVGILANPLEFHTPKLPGLGDVNWGKFFSVLSEAGYDGAVCVEVEDRDYEGTLEGRQAALRESAAFVRQYIR